MTVPGDRVVVDATVAIKWVVGEPDSDRAAALRGRRIFAPDLLVPECANVLWKKVARKELGADEADMAARLLQAAEIELVVSRPLMRRSLALAVTLGHSAYDCTYLAVGEAHDAPLVTADTRFVAAVRGRGGPLARLVVPLAEITA